MGVQDRECIHYESQNTMLSLWVAQNEVRLIRLANRFSSLTLLQSNDFYCIAPGAPVYIQMLLVCN